MEGKKSLQRICADICRDGGDGCKEDAEMRRCRTGDGFRDGFGDGDVKMWRCGDIRDAVMDMREMK